MPSSAGYMGHDTVAIREGVINRTFPTYDDTGRIRIDHQWDVEDGMRGEMPIKTGTDTHTDPSGRTGHRRFDYVSFTWR